MQAKLGAPRWLTFIVCLWGACAALMACMRNGTEFVMLRLALGVFEAGTFPGIWYAPAAHPECSNMLSALRIAISVSNIAVAFTARFYHGWRVLAHLTVTKVQTYSCIHGRHKCMYRI